MIETKRFIEFVLAGKTKFSEKIGPLALHSAVSVIPQWLAKRADNKNFWTNFHKWNFAQNDPLTVSC